MDVGDKKARRAVRFAGLTFEGRFIPATRRVASEARGQVISRPKSKFAAPVCRVGYLAIGKEAAAALRVRGNGPPRPAQTWTLLPPSSRKTNAGWSARGLRPQKPFTWHRPTRLRRTRVPT